MVGGGFGGLRVVRALARSPCDVVLVDRRNHHVFQPLLYQVATAALSPADIALPIRTIVRGYSNCEVRLAEATRVRLDDRVLETTAGDLSYDYLVLAAGATHAYFGNEEWAPHAPGLKSIEDALEIRRRVLRAFETAELAEEEEDRRTALSFVVTIAFFTLTHPEWLAALVTGIIYTVMLMWTHRIRDAVIAHCVSNAVLAGWVITHREWVWW